MQSFTSNPPTPVSGAQETKLTNGFASFEFPASKQQLFNILSDRTLAVHLVHKA